MKKLIVLLVLMLSFFIISGLFFLNSGIIDKDDGELDEAKTMEILYELDSIPFVNMDVDKIMFDTRGTVKEIGNGTFSIASREGDEDFAFSINASEIKEGDSVRVYYRYSPEIEQEVTKVVKKG